jgi:hypothetical protein
MDQKPPVFAPWRTPVGARVSHCTFRSSMVALDIHTGRIVWKTYTIPEDGGFEAHGADLNLKVGGLAGASAAAHPSGECRDTVDDSIQITARAGAADVQVTLEVWPHMIHAWPLFCQQLTDGRRAITAAGSFIRAAAGQP